MAPPGGGGGAMAPPGGGGGAMAPPDGGGALALGRTRAIEPVVVALETALVCPSRCATKLCKHLGHLICNPLGGILLSLMLYSAPHFGQMILIDSPSAYRRLTSEAIVALRRARANAHPISDRPVFNPYRHHR